MPRFCSVLECQRPYYAKGLCNMHWMRVRTHGTTDGGPTTHAPPEVRFWRYVKKGEDGDCWPWAGKTEKNGYGRFQVGGKGSSHLGAHRYSLELATGEKPPVVMHKCDNPICVNPSHLQAATHKENTADMIAKGRMIPGKAIGARNYNTKLNPDDVRAIRQRTGDTAGSVGREFNVDHGTILAIWRRITWRHIT